MEAALDELRRRFPNQFVIGFEELFDPRPESEPHIDLGPADTPFAAALERVRHIGPQYRVALLEGRLVHVYPAKETADPLHLLDLRIKEFLMPPDSCLASAIANIDQPVVNYAAFAGSEDILGTWFNQAKDAKIDVIQCGNDYCGKTVWLKEPDYPAGSKLGTPGTPKLDHYNLDPAHKKDPLMGMQIMQGFQFSGGNLWKNGKIYDPDSGKTYSAQATLMSHDQLNLRGFIGISMFGRTEKWTRPN